MTKISLALAWVFLKSTGWFFSECTAIWICFLLSFWGLILLSSYFSFVGEKISEDILDFLLYIYLFCYLWDLVVYDKLKNLLVNILFIKCYLLVCCEFFSHISRITAPWTWDMPFLDIRLFPFYAFISTLVTNIMVHKCLATLFPGYSSFGGKFISEFPWEKL